MASKGTVSHLTMTITINLPPAAEEQLRAQAAATGKNISTLVAEAVEARLALAQLQLKDILAPVHADVRRSGMTAADLDALLDDSLENVRSERRSGPGSPA
jgi:hypothetical protein